MRRWKLFLLIGAIFAVCGVLFFWAVTSHVTSEGEKNIRNWRALPRVQAAIVLGAAVWQNRYLSHVLQDRVETAIRLYRMGKVRKLLMSGAHHKKNYDEVNAMRRYALRRGVAARDIFMDHAGFTTYETMYRAKAVFLVKSAIVVTQRYHLPRALYIAKKMGIKAYGIAADQRQYMNIEFYKLRELFAVVKAWWQAGIWQPEPTFLGRTFPIFGDGRLTRD